MRTATRPRWDVVPVATMRLSHDLPCLECGHGVHRYLPCSDACTCTGTATPGAPSRPAEPAGRFVPA